MRSSKLLLGVSSLAILLGIDALAQNLPSSGDAAVQPTIATENDKLEEVVVTARRREEKLQAVPIAISAISGESLAARTINSAVDLGKLVPALNIAGTNRNLEGYSIRGMSNSGASAQGQSPVITPYFAEVPYPTGDGGGPGRFFDLENVQVLKGPQGTLFGRNSTGGAILFQPAKPGRDFSGYAQAQFGNYGDEELQGAVNVPVVDDKLMVRLAGNQAKRDGFTKDILNGKDLDNRDYWAGRFSVTARPSDDFENYFVADSLYSDTKGSSEATIAFNPSLRLGTVAGLPLLLFGNGPTAASAATVAGRAAAATAGNYAFFPLSLATQYLQRQAALGPRQVAIGNSPLEKFWSWGLADIARWDISESVTLRNIFGYREYKQLTRYDDDGTPLPILGQTTAAGQSINLAQYTEELQFQGHVYDDSLTWVAGVFGLFAHPAGQNAITTTQFGSSVFSDNHATTRSEAIYAQATYDLGHSVEALNGFKFTAGYRFSWDYRSLDLVQKNAAGACSALGADSKCDVSVSFRGSQPSWNVGLDYQVAPGTLVYASARRGFRSGGLNTQSLIVSQIAYKPETVQDVEIGVKSDWEAFGVKARTNIEAFHTDYKSKQASQSYSAIINGAPVTTNIIVNAGDVTIEGIDADLTLIPVDGLELTASWAHNEARYDKYLIVATGQVVNGQTYPFVPMNKLSLNARYRLPVAESLGDMFLSAGLSYQSHLYLGTTPSDPASTTIGGNFSTIDLSVDWQNVLGRPVDISLFATNVTDTVYRIGGFPVYGTAGFAAFFYGEPQMYGAKVKYRW